MPGIRLHERTQKVEEARNELDGHLLDIIKKHDLTYGEILLILSLEASTWAKYTVRHERHPDDPDKKGDEA